ncbi:MAG: histidine kinase [Hyphomicrobiales bacterium]|nr:histidine kinase [Hyphomicrobiales bacterium]MDE2016507.1 histidine kinase [Hyphomicrobiales bacterium]
MRSLLRLLFFLGLIAGAVYGGMVALVTFVHVEPRDISTPVDPALLNK